MPLTAPTRRYTVTEYLALEERAEEKHEYDNGEILAMSGGTFAHSQIALNVGGELRSRLKGQSCQALESNMRLRLPRAGKYVYPDVTVVCGRVEFDVDDPKRTTITNPAAVVEVLSESTEKYDRGKEFEAYQTVVSLKEYVLVSQWEPHVSTYFRHDDDRWTIRSFSGIDSVVRFQSLGIELPMREIYLNVEFQPATQPQSEES